MSKHILFALIAASAYAGDAQPIVRKDHYVAVRSIAPSMKDQTAQIYVREVVAEGISLRRDSKQPIVLFIHGAGTPAEVAFDVPYRDYSWMAYLANAGYDTFSMDMTGYGRSTRPTVMNDRCNLSKEQQAQFSKSTCDANIDRATTIESDWHDIGAVVDYIRGIRGGAKLNLVGWSLGGPRAGGYAAQNQDKIARIALLAPAYFAGARAMGVAGMAQAPFNTQSRADFDANWNRQLGCPDQFDPAAREAVWKDMLASDAVGATWGDGMRRAPNVGGNMRVWNAETVGKMRIPALFIAAVHDKQALPERVKTLYRDYGAAEKVFLDLGCTSHNALWERNHLILFQASLEWFNAGAVSGTKSGEVKLGY